MTLRARLLAAAGHRVGPGPFLRSWGRAALPLPRISVVITAQAHPSLVFRSVQSVLDSRFGSDFEVIVVDQSRDNRTAIALRAFDGDDRLCYARSLTSGPMAGRNEGVGLSRAGLIAFVDERYTVDPEWLAAVETAFLANPRAGAVLGQIRPGTPGVRTRNSRLRPSRYVTSLIAAGQGIGINAGLAVRRSALSCVGLFDDVRGVGALPPDAGNHDMVLRMLLHDWSVLETRRAAMFHDRSLPRTEPTPWLGDWWAIGATHARLLKAEGWRMSPLIAWNVFAGLLGAVLPAPVIGRRHGRATRRLWYSRGLLHGLRAPVQPRSTRSRCSRHSTDDRPRMMDNPDVRRPVGGRL